MIGFELRREEKARFKEVRENAMGHNPTPGAGSVKIARPRRDARKRKFSPLAVMLGSVMLDLGMSQGAVQRALRCGAETASDIKHGRLDGDGRLAMELDPGEMYCEPTPCKGCDGALIVVTPCRACAARKASK